MRSWLSTSCRTATGKLNKLALRQKYQNYLLENPVVA
jgi:hypothetical protein